MAYRKKGAKSVSRRTYRRRYTRRRRYRRKYPRRSGRRFPKGTEVKSVNRHFSGTVVATNLASPDRISYVPGFCCTIGGSHVNNFPNNIPIANGNAQGQRVGVKIEPIKLRFSGSFSLQSNVENQPNFAPNFWQVRCIIYQVKGGNASHEANNMNYHQLAIESEDGFVNAGQISKILAFYQNSGDTTFLNSNWIFNNGLAQVPLRRGIGGICRILYKRSFWINTQKNPVKQFRFVTRCPKRLVYPETVSGAESNAAQYVANNCIYCLWLFQPGSFIAREIPKLEFSISCDMFYTDK